MTEAAGSFILSRDMTRRLLFLNLEGIPKMTIALTDAIYHLAMASSDIVQRMRDEIKTAMRQDGWTLGALDRMYHVDNFLKESMRVNKIRSCELRL